MPVYAQDDLGLGYCLRCLERYKAGTQKARPNFAITSGPVPVSGPGGQMIAVVAVPVCYDEVTGGQAQGQGLIIAGSLS